MTNVSNEKLAAKLALSVAAMRAAKTVLSVPCAAPTLKRAFTYKKPGQL